MRCKKIITVISLVSLMSMLFLVGCKKEDTLFNGNDFRVGNWGDPLYLIEKNEGAMITLEGDSRLVYWDSFLGYDANVSYIFYEEKLSNGYFELESSQSTDIVYANVNIKLGEMYGKPIAEDENSTKYKRGNGYIYVSKAGLNCTVLMGQ